MLFVATSLHPASGCPLQTSEGKTILKNLFSEENVKKSGINLVNAYISCPKDFGALHKSFFTIEANNVAMVNKFFGSMSVEIKQVLPFSEVVKTL